MISLQFNDKRLVENAEALQYLRSLHIYSEEELQKMYDEQVEKDREREEGFSDSYGFVVTDECIERNRERVREEVYIAEVILTRDAFVEAYNKWIKGAQ